MALVNSSIAEYVTKDLKLLGLKDRDAAAIRDTRQFSAIFIEGYDTSLQKYATHLTLAKPFGSCGNILNISLSKSGALMRFEGKGAQEKALKLSGTDAGGWTAVVKAATWAWQRKPYDPCDPIIKDWSFFAKGYDTGLAEIDIEIALCKHFSSCGEVMDVMVFSSGRAQIHIEGEGCLELSGRQVGEMNLAVELPPSMEDDPGSPKNGKRKKMTYRLPCGYTPLESKLEFANKKKEKNKKKEEKKKLKKAKENDNHKEMEMMDN